MFVFDLSSLLLLCVSFKFFFSFLVAYEQINESSEKQWHLERARIIFAIEHELSEATRAANENKYWTVVNGKRYLQVMVRDDEHFKKNNLRKLQEEELKRQAVEKKLEEERKKEERKSKLRAEEAQRKGEREAQRDAMAALSTTNSNSNVSVSRKPSLKAQVSNSNLHNAAATLLATTAGATIGTTSTTTAVTPSTSNTTTTTATASTLAMPNPSPRNLITLEQIQQQTQMLPLQNAQTPSGSNTGNTSSSTTS